MNTACVYRVLDCAIAWTTHAIDRVAERFGFKDEIEIPNERMAKAHRLVEDGEEFHIRTALVEFVCVRDCLGMVVVKTVLFAL